MAAQPRPRGLRGFALTLPGKARRTALSDRHTVQANIHAASKPCRLKIACTRGFQVRAAFAAKRTSRFRQAWIKWHRVARNQRCCARPAQSSASTEQAKGIPYLTDIGATGFPKQAADQSCRRRWGVILHLLFVFFQNTDFGPIRPLTERRSSLCRKNRKIKDCSDRRPHQCSSGSNW